MKRLLDILFVLAAMLTIQIIVSDTGEHIQQDNMDTIINGTPSTLDIPFNNQAHRFSSREFTAPSSTRTINHTEAGTISVAATYTLHKRVNNISSHFTQRATNTGSHKYISYGILRV